MVNLHLHAWIRITGSVLGIRSRIHNTASNYSVLLELDMVFNIYQPERLRFRMDPKSGIGTAWRL